MTHPKNQVIVNKAGHSWLGFYTNKEKFIDALTTILLLSQNETYKSGKWANAFWVLDLDGGCVAAQSTLSEALKYYNYNQDSRVLVHYQNTFI